MRGGPHLCELLDGGATLTGDSVLGLHDAEGTGLYAPLMARVHGGTPSDVQAALASIHALAEQRDSEADWVTYVMALLAAIRTEEATSVLEQLRERFDSGELVAVCDGVIAYLFGDNEMREGVIAGLAVAAQPPTMSARGRQFAQVVLEDIRAQRQASSDRIEAIQKLRIKADGGTASAREVVRLGQLLLEADYDDPDAGFRFEAVQRLQAAPADHSDHAELLAVLVEHLGRIGATTEYYDALDELACLNPVAPLVQSPPDPVALRASPSNGLETRIVQDIAAATQENLPEVVRTAGLKAAYFPYVSGLRIAYALGLALSGEPELATGEAEHVANTAIGLSHNQHWNLATVYRLCGRTIEALGQAEQARQAATNDVEIEQASALIAELTNE